MRRSIVLWLSRVIPVNLIQALGNNVGEIPSPIQNAPLEKIDYASFLHNMSTIVFMNWR